MVVEAVYTANAQAVELARPGVGAFNDPAVPSQSAVHSGPTPCNAEHDGVPWAFYSAVRVIIGLAQNQRFENFNYYHYHYFGSSLSGWLKRSIGGERAPVWRPDCQHVTDKDLTDSGQAWGRRRPA